MGTFSRIVCTVIALFTLLESCQTQPLLLLMIDGTRWDYIHRLSFGWSKIKTAGTIAEYMIPVFPSDSYPNWNSLYTGLYPENHGMPMNFMYDEVTDEFFLQHPHPNVSHSHWWQTAEPVWITAEKNDRKTALFNWAGCEVEINGTRPWLCEPFTMRSTLQEKVENMNYSIKKSVDMLQNKVVDLAMVYIPFVDDEAILLQQEHALPKLVFDQPSPLSKADDNF